LETGSILRTAIFRAVSQRVVVIPYWSFETTYRSHLHGSTRDPWRRGG